MYIVPYMLGSLADCCVVVHAGCNGEGHVTGMYAMHYAVSGCPVAAKNKASGAQANKVWKRFVIAVSKPSINCCPS